MKFDVSGTKGRPAGGLFRNAFNWRPQVLGGALILLTGSPAFSQPASFKEAVNLYNAKKYSQALVKFQEVSKTYPQDATCHYYLGLCYQALNQVGQAQQEYQWVASNSRNANLKSMAQTGLDNMSKYSSARTRPGSSPAPVDTGPKTPPPPDATAEANEKAKPGGKPTAVASGQLKVKKVIHFYNSWDRLSMQFEPTFEQTKSQFKGKVDFQRMEADEGPNAELKDKYGVKNLPAIVYLDEKGKVLGTDSGLPSAEELTKKIQDMK